MMRTAILGAGAMGSIFGAELASRDADVQVLDVSVPLVERLNERGVTIRAAEGSRTVPLRATTAPRDQPPADLLIVFVKSWATDAALALAAPLLGPETLVLSLQNGIGNDGRIERRVDPRRVLVGVTYHSATVADLAVVDHTALGTTYVGATASGDPAAALRVAEFLSSAGLPAEALDDVGARIWRKLMLNIAANPVAALTGLRSAALIADAHVDALMRTLTREAVAVARAEGQDFDEGETYAYVRDALRSAGPATSSMRQDVAAGRPTEIDVITGAVLTMAERHGISAPCNATVHALIKGYEAGLAQPQSGA